MFKHSNLVVKILMALILGCDFGRNRISSNSNFAASTTYLPHHATIVSMMEELKLEGDLRIDNIHHAAKDFGNRYSLLPAAVLYPKSVSDVSSLINYIFQMGPTAGFTVAARGHGHSLEGQAQAHQGVVINMESLGKSQGMHFHIKGETSFVDVSAGALWIDILHESLKYGLAPKSWTDYLHLTVGGTLSNAGISGQAFRHGPQINNVYQLEVVTGAGEVVTCTEEMNSDLFHGVLGGLGQFGIITRAQISLEPAPQMVKENRFPFMIRKACPENLTPAAALILLSFQPAWPADLSYYSSWSLASRGGALEVGGASCKKESNSLPQKKRNQTTYVISSTKASSPRYIIGRDNASTIASPESLCGTIH